MMPLLWPTYFMGKETNPPLLFLHGFMGSYQDWLPIAAGLQKDFYCILPDLPGHGNNCREIEFDHTLTLAYIARGAKTLLDQLGIRQTNVLGYSMGGRVALHLALNHPEKIEQLVLENANPGIEDDAARAARARLDQQRATRINDNLDAFIEKWYQAELFASLAAHGARFETMKATRKQNDATWIAKVIAELSPGVQPSVWARLSDLSMPVQLIGGKTDDKYQKILNKMAKLIPDARLSLLAKAGHNAHFEQSKPFTQIVQDFLLEKNQ